MSGWNGSGTYVRDYNWINDRIAGIPITASRMQPDTQDIADKGFGNCLTRDGQGFASANLPMAGFHHTGVGAATANTDYAQVAQVQNSAFTFIAGGGTADAITAAYAPVITSLPDGLTLYVTAPGANTVTNPTFSPNGLTARTITKRGGAALAVAEYASGQRLQLSYVGSSSQWELINAAGISAIANNRLSGNVSGVAKLPYEITITQAIDIIGFTRGSVLYRGSAGWAILGPGTAGQVFLANGSGSDPSWVSPPSGSQLFTSSGTFTVPAGTTPSTLFEFYVTGGGGDTASSSVGAGAGATGIKCVAGLTASSTISVTVGAHGSTGGSSSITIGGTTYTASGGDVSGAPGTASDFTVNLNGGHGGGFTTAGDGVGGASYWGGGACVTSTAISPPYGAGGANGHNGADGAVFVKWR